MKHLLLSLMVITSFSAYSHSGRTNAKGCHNNRSTGDCHNSGKSSSRSTGYNPKPTRKNNDLSESSTYTSVFGNAESSHQGIRRLNYEGFTVWLDCSKRSAVKFMYNAQRDTGNHKRYSRFFLDSKVPANCQQYSAKAYGKKYDRGHLVPANHLDYSKSAIKATNTMTNIAPQAASMNRGAWLMTEEITECYRDIDELLIIGGVLWDGNSSNNFFIKSHGIKTPSAFWKVIIRGTGSNQRSIAWIIPNLQEAKRSKLDQYLVSVAEIERVTNEKIPVPNYSKAETLKQSWMIPYGCNKG